MCAYVHLSCKKTEMNYKRPHDFYCSRDGQTEADFFFKKDLVSLRITYFIFFSYKEKRKACPKLVVLLTYAYFPFKLFFRLFKETIFGIGSNFVFIYFCSLNITTLNPKVIVQ